MDDVVLGHVAHSASKGVVVGVEALVAVQDISLRRHLEAGQRSDKRRLPGARRADDAEQRLRVEREGHVVEQHARVRKAHGEAERRICHLAGVDVLAQRVSVEPERVPSDHQHVAGCERAPDPHAARSRTCRCGCPGPRPPTNGPRPRGPPRGAGRRARRPRRGRCLRRARSGAVRPSDGRSEPDRSGAVSRSASSPAPSVCAAPKLRVIRSSCSIAGASSSRSPCSASPSRRRSGPSTRRARDGLAIDEHVFSLDRLDRPTLLRVPDHDVPGGHAVAGDSDEAAPVGADDDLRESRPEHRLALPDP